MPGPTPGCRLPRIANAKGNAVVARVVVDIPESAADLKIRIRKACAAELAAFKLPTRVLLADEHELYSVRLKKRRRA